MELKNTNGDVIILDNKFNIEKIKNLLEQKNHSGIDKYLSTIEGYPKHSEGGVDLTIGKNGVRMHNGTTEVTAAFGLVIPKAEDGMVIFKK